MNDAFRTNGSPRWPWLALCASLLAPACDAEPEPFEDLDDAALEELGEASLRAQYDAMAGHFELVRDDSHASKATASIEVPLLDDDGEMQFVGGHYVRGTCGATFISPHYAVTAAHCVDEDQVPDPEHDTVLLTHYDISAVLPWHIGIASIVDGMFPHYESPYSLSDLSTYHADESDCRVVSRCAYGSYECNFSGDVALLYCPSRENDEWIPIASSDPQTGPVEMYWFHELLDMPLSAPIGRGVGEALDHYNHYTVWAQGQQANNFHYLSSPTNVLLPLRSVDWSGSGGPRRRLGNNRTDLFGCHGTSGSGVFQRGANGELELLGPVSTGAISWVHSRLCMDPHAAKPGIPSLTYAPNAKTRQLQSAFAFRLMQDRNGISVNPPGPGVFDPG